MPQIPDLNPIVSYIVTVIIPGIIGALLALVVGNWTLQLIVRIIAAGAVRSRVKPALIDLIKAALTTVGWILILAAVLQTLGMSEIAIALGGTISLVALGLSTAASGNLGDIIAGIFLASDPDFSTGYVISMGPKDDKLIGVIERIDLRKTRIRTPDGRLHVVPNKQIESSIWVLEARPTVNTQAPMGPALPNLQNLLPRRRPRPDDVDNDNEPKAEG
ncbi:MAG: mechanosensitive ion channel family protein [Anaerolineae bacterium]|nr:mechanosensitive ion channel family protein [Anaerolineae bacterium]